MDLDRTVTKIRLPIEVPAEITQPQRRGRVGRYQPEARATIDADNQNPIIRSEQRRSFLPLRVNSQHQRNITPLIARKTHALPGRIRARESPGRGSLVAFGGSVSIKSRS